MTDRTINDYSAHSGNLVKNDSTQYNVADDMAIEAGQSIVEVITDTAKHTPAGGKTHWRKIEILTNAVFTELLQSNLYVNGVLTPDASGSQGSVAATGTLSVTGTVVDAETVSIGSDVYEFCADEAQTVSEGNIAVDITAYTTKAHGTLTLPVKPTATDTIVIGTTTYTFVADGDFDTAGEIPIGENVAATQVNIVAAINGTDLVNSADPAVTAADFADNACVITALIGGVAGNSIGTTETFTAETNAFAAATLGSGADCSAANGITALVAAINANDAVGVGATDGTGDTVVLVADIKGTAGNSITTTETMSHASFGGGTLSGGASGTVAAGSVLRGIFTSEQLVSGTIKAYA